MQVACVKSLLRLIQQRVRFDVRVTIKDADAAIKLGMTAGVRFDAAQAQQPAAVHIPSTALTQINGRNMVWVIDANNKAQPREVVAGEFTENGILITSGLQIGERIAVAGCIRSLKIQLVKPIPEAKL